MRNLKQFLANKNVVTLLGIVLIVLVVYGFYNWRVNQATNPIRIPYANVTIPARTEITADMISYVDVPQTALRGNVLTNPQTQIIGMYTDVGSTIPVGSYFYNDVVVLKSELPDSYLIDIPQGTIAYSFDVDVTSTYGNSMYPGNYVDVYFKGIEDDKVMLGKLVENVKILAVKDNSGNHVFEGTGEQRQPSQIIFAVTSEIHRLLRSAEYLKDVELILVPTNVSYVEDNTDMIVTNITNEYIKAYIEDRSVSLDD